MPDPFPNAFALIQMVGAFLPFFIGVAFGSESETGALDSRHVFFESKVRPLLAARCLECHGKDKPKAGLRLDSRRSILSGSQNGPVVTVGKPGESFLIELIEGRNPDLVMPPKGERLSTDEKETLRKWVEVGLPWTGDDGHASELPEIRQGAFTQADKEYWAFKPVTKTEIPSVKNPDWCRNEIDAFILARLEAEGLKPSREADRREWLRRMTFDLHGLPPSEREMSDFIQDSSADAYSNKVRELLASPRYGEKWARHWLDLVRYSESDGFRADHYRPEAWRYRDYVIQSLNDDKPYDQFVLEQLAADEIAPGRPEVLVATGFLRHGIYEYNQRHVENQWNEMLDELTDTTADVFLGMGLACARCHDHKFDPILRKDYYRLRAFFAPILPRDDFPLATAGQWLDYTRKNKKWEQATESIRSKIRRIETPVEQQHRELALSKFDPVFREMILKPQRDRTPLEHQLAQLAYRQVVYEDVQTPSRIKGEAKEEYDRLLRELEKFEHLKPAEPPRAMVVTDVGACAPPTYIPGDRSQEEVLPGFPAILDPGPADIAILPTAPNSTGRRTALARWIADKDNPLTARVMVNRIWQHHFGRGLVASSSDFGRLGQAPSHPELLDWLAARFMEKNWSLKAIHEMILLSAAYRQTAHATGSSTAKLKDPDNRLLWKMNSRRLQAEEIRDAFLFVSGELDNRIGGASVNASVPRRTIYTQYKRNSRDPLMDVFDLPLGIRSAPERHVTTTASQALLLLNSPWTLARAKVLALTILTELGPDPARFTDEAYRRVFSRPPSQGESADALAFLERQGRLIGEPFPTESESESKGAEAKVYEDFLHALLNSSEFIYVD